MKQQYKILYKNPTMDSWREHGIYTRTDALGTANNLLKLGDEVRIVPYIGTMGNI